MFPSNSRYCSQKNWLTVKRPDQNQRSILTKILKYLNQFVLKFRKFGTTIKWFWEPCNTECKKSLLTCIVQVPWAAYSCTWWGCDLIWVSPGAKYKQVLVFHFCGIPTSRLLRVSSCIPTDNRQHQADTQSLQQNHLWMKKNLNLLCGLYCNKIQHLCRN